MVGFLLLAAIWGSSFLLIKVAVTAGVAPVWVALYRCLFGAVTLLALCAAGRHRLPSERRTWAHAAVVAALLNAAPFTLLALGEQRVSSVLAGVLNASTPLTTLLFALLLVPGERLTGRRLAGVALGFLGVLCLFGVWRGVPGGTLTGASACLGATTCYGAGFAYTRRYYAGRGDSAVALSAALISAATVELACVAPLAGPPGWPGTPAFGCLLLLGALGTGAAYILNLGVIRTVGAAAAATVTYLTPVFSTLLGAVLLAEPVGASTLAGGVAVVAGVLLTRARPGRPVERPTASASDRC